MFAFGHLLKVFGRKAVLYLLPPVPFKYLLSTLEFFVVVRWPTGVPMPGSVGASLAGLSVLNLI